MLRETTAVALSCFLALGPTSSAWAATSNGTVSGQVTVEGRPLQGMGLAVVDLKSGEIHRTKSDAQGNYRVRVQPGEYVVTSLSLAGLAVGKAPTRVVVEQGRVVVASLELIKLPVAFQTREPQQPPAPPSGPQTQGNITWDPPGCLVAGQYWQVEARVSEPASIARARVYFKSALGTAYYFVEMTVQTTSASQMGGTKLAAARINGAMLAAAAADTFVAKMPKPTLAGSPVTAYVVAIGMEGAEFQTAEAKMLVVADESECPEGLKVAPIGPPGAVTVFSAAGTVAVPIGFAAGTTLVTVLTTAAGFLLSAGAITAGVEGGRDSATTTTSTTSTTTTTTTTTSTTTSTVLNGACQYIVPNCSFDPVSQLPNNCPCLAGQTEKCATRVAGQPCPPQFPNDKVTECCSSPTQCSSIGQPSLPPPSNPPCDTTLPPVIK